MQEYFTMEDCLHHHGDFKLWGTRQVHYVDHCQMNKEAVRIIHETKPASEVSIGKCGTIKEVLFLTAKILGNFILQKINILHLNDIKFLPEPYVEISWKSFTYATCFYIELCQIVCDPCEIHFMLLRPRSHTLHILFTHMLTSIMEVMQKNMLQPFGTTLHIHHAERYGV